MMDEPDTRLRDAQRRFNAFLRQQPEPQSRDDHGRFQSTADAPVDRSLDQGPRGATGTRHAGTRHLPIDPIAAARRELVAER